MENLDLSDEMLKALKSLPPKQLQCFLLHVIDGYKYKEIAEMLGITSGTVRTHIFRAKKNIKYEQL